MASQDIRVSPPSLRPPSSKSRWPWSRVRARLERYIEDVDAVMTHDPAARNRLEVVLTYPGVHAIWAHRFARKLWYADWVLPARIVSHTARLLTGIEIHPGATIGRRVFIDHGMGVVIGETATVGDGCILYQGAVLGGTTMARQVRHPQLGKQVVVGSHACVLGAIEVSDGARIGSGSVVIRSVPVGGTVVGVPGRVVSNKKDKRARFDATLDHSTLPDPVAEMLRSLRDDNERLRQRLMRLEEKLQVPNEDEEDPHLVDGALSTNDLPPQHGG